MVTIWRRMSGTSAVLTMRVMTADRDADIVVGDHVVDPDEQDEHHLEDRRIGPGQEADGVGVQRRRRQSRLGRDRGRRRSGGPTRAGRAPDTGRSAQGDRDDEECRPQPRRKTSSAQRSEPFGAAKSSRQVPDHRTGS